MWEYRIEYVGDTDLVNALNFYGKESWEVYQIEKDVEQRENYGDIIEIITYIVYMKKLLN